MQFDRSSKCIFLFWGKPTYESGLAYRYCLVLGGITKRTLAIKRHKYVHIYWFVIGALAKFF